MFQQGILSDLGLSYNSRPDSHGGNSHQHAQNVIKPKTMSNQANKARIPSYSSTSTMAQPVLN
jgi:hypothetical protein